MAWWAGVSILFSSLVGRIPPIALGNFGYHRSLHGLLCWEFAYLTAALTALWLMCPLTPPSSKVMICDTNELIN